MAILRSDETKIVPAFLYYVLNTEQMRDTVRGTSGGSNIQNLSGSIGNLPIPLPPMEVQREVVRECAHIDGERQEALREVMRCKEGIAALFATIGTSGQYPTVRLESLLESITGNITKIDKSAILEEGKYPVVTQESGRLVSGYSDNEDVITDVPLIVFGDHSCTFKYVDFPFLRGADGTQLLKISKNQADIKFIYYYLSTVKIENSGKYERHFKYLKSLPIPLPPLAVQRALVEQAAELEALIARSGDKAAACAQRKQALLDERL